MHEELVELIERSKVAFPKLGNGVSDSAVIRAEESLGIPLPDTYRWWLTNYGGGQINGDIVYGLDENGQGRPDIVDLATMNEKDGFYDIKRLVFSIGEGENFFFDTTREISGEYEVFLHDVNQDEINLYASNFAEFLRKRIRELCVTRN